MSTGTLVQADESLEYVQSFAQLYHCILKLLRENRGPIDRPHRTTIVLGPVAACNGRSKEENLQALSDASADLAQRGWVVLDLTSFGAIAMRLARQQGVHEDSSARQIADFLVEQFTDPILRSGYLHAVHFLSSWSYSYGATIEHTLAEQERLDIYEVEVPLPDLATA